MSNVQRSNHSVVKADEISQAVWQTLTNSVFPGAKDESIMMALHYCEARGLDVLKKPVHIVPMSVKDAQSGKYIFRDVIMPGIAELRTTASRAGSYCGQTAPEFGESKSFQIGRVSVEAPEYCTVTVFKLINDQQVGFSHTEFFTEACATTKDGDLNSMWKKRPRGQLAKCAEAGALRKAFPEDLGGEISFDEMPEGGAVGEAPNGQTIIEQADDQTIASIKKGIMATGTEETLLLEKYEAQSIDSLMQDKANAMLGELRQTAVKQKAEQKQAAEQQPAKQQAEKEVDY